MTNRIDRPDAFSPVKGVRTDELRRRLGRIDERLEIGRHLIGQVELCICQIAELLKSLDAILGMPQPYLHDLDASSDEGKELEP